MIEYSLDITDRKHNEEQLRRLFRAVEQSPASIVITDTSGRIDYVNPRFTETTGYTFEEAFGQNPRILKSGKQPVEVYQQMWQTLSAGRVWRGELENRAKDGHTYWEQASISPVRNTAGEITHYVAVKENITQYKRLLEELEQSRNELERRVLERTHELADANASLQQEIAERKIVEEALAAERRNLENTVALRTKQLQESLKKIEEANQHKSRFLSSMSHEFRTPLNAILGFADLLSKQFFGSLNEKQAQYVNLIEQSGNHLLALINDLLDIAKIDAGRVELLMNEFSITDLLQDSAQMVSTQCRQKHITLEVTPPSAVDTITGDLRRCRQIMLNLLSNAVKFTPEYGRIMVSAEQESPLVVKFSVQDTGIGIDLDKQDKIFSEFYQADQVRDAEMGGTGIGLALTRRLVQLHHGEIGVVSEPGKGSTFWFTLPIRKNQKPAAFKSTAEPEAVSVELTGHRVLVVEDNRVNQYMIVEMLNTQGMETAIAENGQEALELVQSFKPEVILMDMVMPVMDGVEATRRLKGGEAPVDTPIIALTANADPESVAKCLEAGCVDHLAKPIQSRELMRLLRQAIGRKSTGKA